MTSEYRWADAGYRVLAADPSPSMLALAREAVPGADLRQVAAADLDPPPCVGVAAVGEVLGYLPDPRAGVAALRIVAERARRALVPGGLLEQLVVNLGHEQGLAGADHLGRAGRLVDVDGEALA